MKDMAESISLFSDKFMPHGHCYMWKPEILWLHVISDAIIFLAYMAIPFALAYIVSKTNYRLKFNGLLILFCIFIVACGTSHFIEIINVWKAEYFVAGIIKAVTAIVSLLTAIALVPYIPKIIVHLNSLEENEDEERS